MGNVFDSLGQDDKALEFFTKALNISRELGNTAEEGIAYLGNVFYGLGQYDN